MYAALQIPPPTAQLQSSLRVQFPVTFQVPAMHVAVYGVPVPLKVQLLLQTPPEGTLLHALPLANSQLPPFAAAGGAESHDLTASSVQWMEAG
jgi:hypothetical protein